MVNDLLKRFDEKYIPEPNSGCWLWLGAVNAGGYGVIRVQDKIRSAHRVSHELFKGKIPDGLGVLHFCDTPACVNPAHLRAGTPLENTQDMDRRGRARRAGPGEANPNKKLTLPQVAAIRARYRYGERSASLSALAAEYGVARSTIRRIIVGLRWGAVSSSNL